MKNKIVTFFLFLLMLALISGLLFVGWAIYNDMIVGEVVETIHTEDNLVAIDKGESTTVKQRKSIVDTITDIFTTEEPVVQDYSVNSSVGNYFYEQLSSTQKVYIMGFKKAKIS